jgi:hypothetical protein
MRTAKRTSYWFGLATLATVLAVPLLAGCQGSLEGGPYPARHGMGTGGGSGSGGSIGTGGSGSGGSSGVDCDAPTMIFKNPTVGCAGDFCHDGTFEPNLSKSDVASTIRATTALSLCTNDPMADPADPMGSVLYKVVKDKDTCGDQMPQGGTPLTDSQKECLANWIAHLP